MTIGYSGTPLPKKPGITSPMRVAVLNAPAPYASMLGGVPPDVTITA